MTPDPSASQVLPIGRTYRWYVIKASRATGWGKRVHCNNGQPSVNGRQYATIRLVANWLC
uniref:Uncharacterized protein n=1 Tax=Anopheles minimus TaxID=112268 RepID=A0A182W444_9DIPT